MIVLPDTVPLETVKRRYPDANVQRTRYYVNYAECVRIVVQFATRAEEHAARALVTGKGKDDDRRD